MKEDLDISQDHSRGVNRFDLVTPNGTRSMSHKEEVRRPTPSIMNNNTGCLLTENYYSPGRTPRVCHSKVC
jgi:hypothetical protein